MDVRRQPLALVGVGEIRYNPCLSCPVKVRRFENGFKGIIFHCSHNLVNRVSLLSDKEMSYVVGTVRFVTSRGV